jgi:hypothetical protein
LVPPTSDDGGMIWLVVSSLPQSWGASVGLRPIAPRARSSEVARLWHSTLEGLANNPSRHAHAVISPHSRQRREDARRQREERGWQGQRTRRPPPAPRSAPACPQAAINIGRYASPPGVPGRHRPARVPPAAAAIQHRAHPGRYEVIDADNQVAEVAGGPCARRRERLRCSPPVRSRWPPIRRQCGR